MDFQNIVGTEKAASAEVAAGRGFVTGVYYVASGTAGSIVLKDGGASGTTKATISTPASATTTQYIPLPHGIRFETSIYVAITNVTKVTIFHES